MNIKIILTICKTKTLEKAPIVKFITKKINFFSHLSFFVGQIKKLKKTRLHKQIERFRRNSEYIQNKK